MRGVIGILVISAAAIAGAQAPPAGSAAVVPATATQYTNPLQCCRIRCTRCGGVVGATS